MPRRNNQRVLRPGSGPHLGENRFRAHSRDRRFEAGREGAERAEIWEAMERFKTADAGKRLATVLLSPGSFGRPIVGGPGIPADRVKILREGFMKAMQDPELSAVELLAYSFRPNHISRNWLDICEDIAKSEKYQERCARWRTKG